MTITPAKFAVLTRQSRNWADAQSQVRACYRKWLRGAPEIQTMYNIRHPISTIRTRIRQEFERHRYVTQLPVVDVLIFKGNADYQETMNFWRQTTNIMSYFKGETFLGDKKLPSDFMSGFLEGRN